MTSIALIVAAGRGLRAGGDVPKQYRDISGGPMLHRTVSAILSDARFAKALVVIGAEDHDLYHEAINGLDQARLLAPVRGGETRALSVKNGLDALTEHAPKHVFIQDAARPFITAALLDPIFDALTHSDGAFPALPVIDALWKTESGRAMTPQSRTELVRAQTPQAFDFVKIHAAFASADLAAHDDVAIARAAGMSVAVTPGQEENFKVTTPEDFAKAESQLSVPDIRTGNGYDVHRFCDGDAVILCGVDIPHNRALSGHSDADVGMHAITDAIFGALAKGDIGQWFPPSDMKWKGAASDIFLRKAVEVAKEDGFVITHVDCTLICELPKIGPHAEAMRLRLSELMGLEVARISVKATTSERLGFTGREEGIAAQATATLVRA